MNLEEISKIPILDIEEYVKIRTEKNHAIKSQKYEKAAQLRDMEKVLINKYPILDTILNYEDIISIIRDRKINDIINDDAI